MLDPAEIAALLAPVAAEEKLALGVSGGNDSLGLMLLVHDWCRQLGRGPEIHVFSVDHGLRAEAADECAWVAAIARRLGFQHQTLVWEGDKPVSGIQAAARAARYRLMGRAMEKHGIGVLLVAHHRQDQAETLLMRLAHGSGPDGLCGMGRWSEVAGTRIFRPLLNVDPAQLRERVAAAGLVGVADPSNADRAFERVRWRSKLDELAPMGLDGERLGRFGYRMGRVRDALEFYSGELFAQIVTLDHFGVARVALPAFLRLPAEMQIRILGRMLVRVTGGQSRISLSGLERLVEAIMARGGDGKFARTAGGAQVLFYRGCLLVHAEPGRREPPETVLEGPGEMLWDQRFAVRNRGQERIVISPDYPVSRCLFERLAGEGFAAPMGALKRVPRLLDGEGKLVGIGGHVLRVGLECRFAPVARGEACGQWAP